MNLTLDGLAIFFRASLFSVLAGIEALSGLAYLLSSGNIVLRTTYNGASFVGQNASTADYTLFLTLLVAFTVASFLIGMGLTKVVSLKG